ncbi:MAG: hypothetical protein K2J47_04975 [Ruminococcus sp.]|nr:hypothetical protein [Ruminococcus sp.]MDE6788658.1 hypothetical protein [Ruminococcus sp.]
MKKEQFYELLGDVDEKAVKAAEKPPARLPAHTWIKYAAIATACLGIFIGTGFWYRHINADLPKIPDEDTSEQQVIALEYDYINIYYVRNNEICSISEYLPCSPEDIFNVWKQENDIGNDVKLIQVSIKNNGTESNDSFVASYAVGDSFIIEVSVTENLKNYYSVIPEDKLLESLKLTLTGYHTIQFDEYNLIFE